MKQFKWTVVALALGLTACGGGSSSGSTTSTTYTWQIVQLQSVDEDDLASNCIIYADSEENDGEVISAVVATDDYNILYHNSDGSIASTYSSDDISDGEFTISKSDIPDDGYVSFEEVDGGLSDATDVYLFSVQKSLMTDLVINIRQSQGTISQSNCYAGDDYRDTQVSSDDAVTTVLQPSGDVEYYQTSYDFDSVSGLDIATHIPVESPLPATQDTLVTAFDDYDDSTGARGSLSYYEFLSESYVYEYNTGTGTNEYTTSGELTDSGLVDLSWTSSISGTYTIDESAIYAIHDGIVYYWQPLYEGEDITVADSNDVSWWSGYASGSLPGTGWDFEGFLSFTPDDGYFELTVPGLYSFGDVSVVESCDTTADFCLDTDSSYTAEDFNYQRSHIQLETDDGDVVYQSIYAPVSETQVLMSTSIGIDNPTIDTIEVNLMSSDAATDDAVKYLMEQSMDLVALGDDSSTLDSFHDANGYVATQDESDDLLQSIVKSSNLMIQNSN